MAIQMRRGPLAKYDESKMLSGEWGISIDNDTDRQKAFIAFAPGVSKEVMMVEDAEAQIAVATEEAIADATEEAEAWAHGNSFHATDYASGDGTTTAFTLSDTPSSIQAVYVDGEEVSTYTISGSTITFSTAPAVGADNIHVLYIVNTTNDNAEYYKTQAASSASSASGSATTATNQATLARSYTKGDTNTRTGETTDNAEYYKTQAGNSATSASGSATAAAASEEQAEAWADGNIDGTPVGSTAPQYHNNAKYWSDEAAAAAASVQAAKLLGDFASYETTTTASQAYAVGDYLTYDGYLYKVTTAIASGGTIVVSGAGVNVVQTNVGKEIKNRELWYPTQAIASTSGSAGTLATITDARITADHVLTKFVAANSSYITSDITCTTSAGQAVITGTSTAATTAEIVLTKKDN